jgi:predicted anti-sigma-YlaC factor YlaD
MNMDHNEIKELLPDYLNNMISDERAAFIREHLDECSECAVEYESLAGIKAIDVPDPEELFWKTLPQKVRAMAEEETRHRAPFHASLLKPLAAVITIVVVLSGIYLYIGKDATFYDPTYDDPFTEVSIDYTEINEDAIPSLTIEVADNDLFMNGEYSYLFDLTSMSSEEMDILEKQLSTLKEIGG